jgi:penicillin-binding protein 1C
VSRGWLLAATVVLLSPMACIEAAYRAELARVPERPPEPLPELPPMLIRAGGLDMIGTSAPETRGIYPWTLLLALARIASGREVDARLTPSSLAARALLLESGREVRGPLRWTAANLALTVWISRHLSAEEAMASALATMSFGPDTPGAEDAALRYMHRPLRQLDPADTAALIVLARDPSGMLRHRDRWRAARDSLLRRLAGDGVTSEQVLRRALARPLPPSSPPESRR